MAVRSAKEVACTERGCCASTVAIPCEIDPVWQDIMADSCSAVQGVGIAEWKMGSAAPAGRSMPAALASCVGCEAAMSSAAAQLCDVVVPLCMQDQCPRGPCVSGGWGTVSRRENFENGGDQSRRDLACWFASKEGLQLVRLTRRTVKPREGQLHRVQSEAKHSVQFVRQCGGEDAAKEQRPTTCEGGPRHICARRRQPYNLPAN